LVFLHEDNASLFQFKIKTSLNPINYYIKILTEYGL